MFFMNYYFTCEGFETFAEKYKTNVISLVKQLT